MNNVEIITQNDVVVLDSETTKWTKCQLTDKDSDCLTLLIDEKEWFVNRSDAIDILNGDFPKLEQLSETVLECMFDEMLDDVYGAIDICGLEYDASVALVKVDEVAYRTGYHDWLDVMVTDDNIIELNGNYYRPF